MHTYFCILPIFSLSCFSYQPSIKSPCLLHSRCLYNCSSTQATSVHQPPAASSPIFTATPLEDSHITPTHISTPPSYSRPATPSPNPPLPARSPRVLRIARSPTSSSCPDRPPRCHQRQGEYEIPTHTLLRCENVHLIGAALAGFLGHIARDVEYQPACLLST